MLNTATGKPERGSVEKRRGYQNEFIMKTSIHRSHLWLTGTCGHLCPMLLWSSVRDVLQDSVEEGPSPDTFAAEW